MEGSKQNDGRNNNHINILHRLKTLESNGKYPKQLEQCVESCPDIDFNKCWYCEKVFMNSKFLLKHILRRHSEKLILLYRNLCGFTTPNTKNTIEASSDLKDFIGNEFFNLKSDLEMCKNSFSNLNVGTNEYHSETLKHPSPTLNNKTFTVNDKNALPITNELCDLKEVILKTENVVKKLEQQFGEYDSRNKTADDQLECLKKELIIELKSLISESIEKNNVIYHKFLTDLKAEIHELEQIIKTNSEKINSSNQSIIHEIHNNLEQRNQLYIQNKKHKKSKLSKLFSTDNKTNKALNKRLIKSVPKNFQSDEIDESKRIEIELLVEDKLSSLNIPLESELLSCGEFDTKLRLVQSEQELLNKKYKSFNHIRNSINLQANNLAMKKFEAIKFADSKSELKLDNIASVNTNQCEIKTDKTFISENECLSKTNIFGLIQMKDNSQNSISKVISIPGKVPEKITPINYSDISVNTDVDEKKVNFEYKNCTSEISDFRKIEAHSTIANSSASLKLINYANIPKRNFSPTTVKELSPCSSFEYDDDELDLLKQ